jgi:hypothetical protein
LRQGLFETTMLSNLGNLGRSLVPNAALPPITFVTGSMPPAGAMAVSFFSGELNGRRTLALRYRRDAFDRDSAHRLLDSVADHFVAGNRQT